MTAIYSEEAEQDLEDIWLYIAGNNPSAATEFVYKIKNACDVLLAENPKVGKERNDLVEGLRQFSVQKRLIFYRIHAENIEIVRIFHGSQDIDAQF